MKKLLVIGGVIIVAIVAVLIFGLSKIGPLVKTAVNTYGPQITKTEVRLGDVNVSLFSAQAKLKDFFLGNPEGFKATEAITVGSILVDVNESSLTSDTIIIDRIEVLGPHLTYEKTAKTDNFQAIVNNIRSGKGGAASSSKSASKNSGSGKKLIIRDFLLKDGKVNLAASMLGQNKSVSTTLPDIHLTNIGQDKGGLKPEEVFKVIFDTLNRTIHSPAVMNAFSDHFKNLKMTTDSFKKGMDKEIKGLESTIKGVIGK